MTEAPNPLMAALERFEAVEANLIKLERLWAEIEGLIPTGIAYGDDPAYEERTRAFGAILAVLPKIDGWRPQAEPPGLDALADNRFDALELGEPGIQAQIERDLQAPARELREYRFRLMGQRRALVRNNLIELMDAVEADLVTLRALSGPAETAVKLEEAAWSPLRLHIKQIDVLLGSSVQRSESWNYLRRHASWADAHDLRDIETRDWPQVRQALRKDLYGPNEPLPVDVEDLADLVAARPRGPIVTALNWSKLADEDFERLIFSLISDAAGYENPEWQMKTRAPDRGRDLAVTRVIEDDLAATVRQRAIIQCKHWQAKSISLAEINAMVGQMALWDNPPVDLLIVATSGRFTTDAVQWVEQHNAKGQRPRVELWADSHLERLLAARPHLIAEFGLR